MLRLPAKLRKDSDSVASAASSPAASVASKIASPTSPTQAWPIHLPPSYQPPPHASKRASTATASTSNSGTADVAEMLDDDNTAWGASPTSARGSARWPWAR